MGDSGNAVDQNVGYVGTKPDSPVWKLDYNFPQRDLLSTYIGSFCRTKYFEQESLNENLTLRRPCGLLGGCGRPILDLLSRLRFTFAYPEDINKDFDLIVKRLEDLIALATEKFYAFPFKDVPACWRELFREASFIKVAVLAVKGTSGFENPGLQADQVGYSIASELGEAVLDEIIRTTDMALIMAGPPSTAPSRDAIDAILELLQESYSISVLLHEHPPLQKRRKMTRAPDKVEFDRFPSSCLLVPPVANPISRIAELSFERFEAHMLYPSSRDLGPEPIIISGALESWPARNERPWNNPLYLMSRTIGGRRLIPIETGRSYVDEGWGQKIISFQEFMEQYILLNPSMPDIPSGYLAQHDLFAQIPTLRKDIAIPDYCYTSPPPPHHSSPLAARHSQMPRLEEPLLNAWFGPGGTISPLHTDPYHNILAQVVGKKYIRLYAPRESHKLYARGVEDGGIDMGNTSAIDIGVLAGWDGTEEEQSRAHGQFPLFKGAEFVDCILDEGECLYIPVGWWHYVRSLSVSFSVSFWFN